MSPYERGRYGGSLWAVPREPYQSRYQMDRFNSGLYSLPESVVRERFQSRVQWESEQRKISDRARQGYRPQHNSGAPDQGGPSSAGRNRK